MTGAPKVGDIESSRFVAELEAQYGRDLVNFIARRMRSTVDARDIAQETYIRLLRLNRKDLIREPRPYLYRVAANVLYEAELRRRTDAAALVLLASDLQIFADAGYDEQGPEIAELSDRLEQVLAGLSPKCRAVLILHRREQLTYDEIGAELGISSSMVKKYLAQGLRYCREQLQEIR